MHNSTRLDFRFVAAKDKPDAFGPFIRVTNSYNGLRALSFEINNKKLSALKASFNDYFAGLQTCRLPRAYFEPLVCGALLIHEPKRVYEGPKKILEDWSALNRHLNALCDHYFMELGDNAYAAFNAITDFASNPPENCCVLRERHIAFRDCRVTN